VKASPKVANLVGLKVASKDDETVEMLAEQKDTYWVASLVALWAETKVVLSVAWLVALSVI